MTAQRPAGGSSGPGGPGPGGPGGPGGRPGGPGGRGGPGMFGMGMGLPPQKANDFGGSLRRLFGHLRPEAPRIVAVVLLAIVSVFFAVIGPTILANAINVIFEGALGGGIDFGELGTILAAMAGVYVISAVFAWGQSYIMAGVTQRSVLRLRTEVDQKLGRLPLRYFDSHPRGDLLSRVTNDIDNIGQSLQQALTRSSHRCSRSSGSSSQCS